MVNEATDNRGGQGRSCHHGNTWEKAEDLLSFSKIGFNHTPAQRVGRKGCQERDWVGTQVRVDITQVHAYPGPPRAQASTTRARTPWTSDQIRVPWASRGAPKTGPPGPQVRGLGAAGRGAPSPPRGCTAQGAAQSPGGASGRRPARRPRPRPAPCAPRSAPPPGGARGVPRPPTWLSPTQKTRPPWLRHTRAPRGCAAAPQKVKEQREARSRCTVVRTRAAGPRPQRAHRYR